MSSTVFANVENHVLGINDFNKVYTECIPFCAGWEEIACYLDISRHSVATIKANDNDVNKRFSELIAVWLKRERPEQPQPTWKVMCNAIASVDRGSAEQIAKRHQCHCDKCKSTKSLVSCSQTTKVSGEIMSTYPCSEILNVLNSRPDHAELDNHVRTNKWHALGLQLDLDNDELDGFRSACLGDIGACRQKMFALWLKQTEPKPTRQKLLDALRTKAVAEMYIAQQYELHIRQQLSQKVLPDIPDCPIPIDTVQCDIVKLKKLIVGEINNEFADLCELMETCLPNVTREMFQAHLINAAVRDNPTAEKILKEFTNGMKWIDSQSDVEERCKTFLCVFNKMGGNFLLASKRVKTQWIKVAKQKMDVSLSLD